MVESSNEPKGYNGWTNYETWNVALWIGNDEGSYTYWEKEQAEECYREAVEGEMDGKREDWTHTAACQLADRMKDEIGENAPELSGCYADLLSAALGEVNWYEIAEHYVEDLDRDEIEKDILPEPEEEEEEDDEEEEEEEDDAAD